MKTIKLSNGVEMPVLGFGVYQVDPKETERVVSDALQTGYRLIDTAAVYRNEEAVGRAIKNSGIPRRELFITTKLWVQDVSYDKVKKAFDTSMQKLGLDYLDLYLIHQPFNDYYGAWRGMEELYKEGQIRSIGVSNFASDRLVDLALNNEIVPMVNQVETHPFHQQTAAQKVMEEYNIQIESWAPFAEGRQNLFTNETLLAIARRYEKTVAQVVLRWLIQRNVVVIPKSVHKERMQENFDVFSFELTGEDMQTIASMDENKGLFVEHHDPAFVKSMNSFKF